jgi:RNA polymerase sigma factor (sigma-70 family)
MSDCSVPSAPSAPTALLSPPATPTFVDDRDVARAHRVARRVLGCDHLADDAVQEALLTLWRLDAPPPEPVGWLLRTVVHRSLHLRRTLLRRRRHEHAFVACCPTHSDCDNPLHTASAHELAERLEAAREALPAVHKQALDLYENGAGDYQALAERLGVPIGTVRSRLARARQALADAVDEAGGAD